jgi:LysM repeat protein
MKGAAESSSAAAEGIEQFLKILSAEKEIRFYVDGTPNFGHQATTIYLLKRLVNLCKYSGKIAVVYADATSGKSTPQKLALLLAGIIPDDIDKLTVAYGTCKNITFVKLVAAKTLPVVNFGFTGGADNLNTVYADAIQTNCFLRLQPYLWAKSGGQPMPNQVEFLGKPMSAALDLNKVDKTIDLLAYKYDKAIVGNVSQAVWNWYTTQAFNADLKQNTLNAQALAAAASPKAYKFWPAYGLHHFVPKGPNEPTGRDILLNLVITGLSYQATLGFQGPPVILTLMNDFSTLDFSFVEFFANNKIDKLGDALTAECVDVGMMSSKMVQARNAKIAAIVKDLKAFYAQLRPDLNMEVADDLDPAGITQFVKTAKPGELLIIPIGAVPQEVFEYFYANATLPPIFEGQGTSSLVISLGLPYLQTPKLGVKGNNYPSIPLVLVPNEATPKYCNETSATLRVGLENIVTGNDKLTYAEMMASVLKFIVDANKDSELSAYFQALGLYFQNDTNDKLLAGCIGLNMVAKPSLKFTAQPLAATEAALDLDAVYKALTTTWKNGSVDLFAALPGSYLAKFYGTMGGTAFPIVVQQSDIVEETSGGKTTKVSIRSGTTSVFPVPFNVSMDFTADDGPVVSDLHCRALQPWTIDGAPWLGFDNPGFDMSVPEAAAPVIGGMVGTIRGTSLTLQVRYPVENKQWVVTGTFDTPVGIGAFYQMAGGINLVQSLPAPLNSLAGFGLSECQFIYGPSSDDATKSVIQYVMFVMSTSAPWTIVSNPVLQVNPTVKAVITSPGDLKARSSQFDISGEFKIGAGVITVAAQYPNFQITGALTDGTINMEDLSKLFGVDVTQLKNSEVTDFSLLVQPSTSSYQLATAITSDWPIPIPGTSTPIFIITGLGFNVQGATGSFAVSLTGSTVVLPATAKIGLQIGASYATGKGWTFNGHTTSPVSLGAMVQGYGGFDPGSQAGYNIDSMSLDIVTGDSSWVFKCAASNWKIEFLDLTINTASLTVGYNGADNQALAHPALGSTSAMTLALGDDQKGRFADVEADVNWAGMDITAWIKFSTSAGPSWGLTLPKYGLHVEASQNSEQQWVATGSIVGKTLGGIVEDLISFATGSSYGLSAPWNLLDSVPLDAFQLTFNFTTKEVGLNVNIGPIDLGFCSIKSIGINYDSSVLPRKVMLSITGSFPWQSGDTLNWDATKPDSAPSPPGGGNEYLDLRLLALGQHVEVTSKDPFTTVEAVIAALRNLDPDGAPIAGPNPNVQFNAKNSWLVGADFGLMQIKKEDNGGGNALVALGDDPAPGYVVNLSIIFNDPNLYGARIALAGPAAKILDGLVFEVLYRRISDTIGVYQIDLTLPDKMRKFDVGAYSLTLPSLALDIYTNGDFTFDLGFPWNQDFSRSFMVQAIIAGIPVLGAAGFYFGKLSSETSTQVPTIDNGRFDPVIIFGFGITVGIGKDVDYGILKAGFQLTVFGIIQGVIAKFCPYPGNSNLPAQSGQLQDGYYFELQGTFGIIGGLYGSVDFVIIKASVSVSIKVMAQITYISYQDIPISLLASVDVTASVSIDCGLFSITIHFSFSMTIKETFTIHNPNKNPPWHVTSDSRPAMLAAAHARRLSAAADKQHVMLAGDDVTFTWSNLAAVAPVGLTGYWGPALTVAGDVTAKASDQKVCYVNILGIASSDPTKPRAPGDPDTSFDLLAQQILRWIVAASLPAANAPYSADYIDNSVIVSPDDLGSLLTALTTSTDPMPIPADKIDTFMGDQFALNVSQPSSGTFDAAPFPVSPKLVLDVPAYGNTPELTYAFSAFNSASTTYLNTLSTYFKDLTVQVEKETKQKQQRFAAAQDTGPSVATFVFADYFRLIGQQMIEAARDALRSFKYPLTNGASIGAAVQWIGAAGAPEFTFADLIEANTAHELTAKQNVLIYGAAGGTGQDPTFTSIAGGYNNLFTPIVLATANAAAPNILVTGATITYDSKPYSVAQGDSLNDLAAKAGATLADLLTKAPAILSQPGLLATDAPLTIPGGAVTRAAEAATFNSIAAAYQNLFSGTALATANATSINLLTPGAEIKYQSQNPYPVGARDSLNDVAAHFGVPLATFLQNAPAVLDQQGLIATFATLRLPDFTYSTADNSQSGVTADTPATIAQRFGINAQALATATNAGVTFEQVKITTLDLPHLAQLKVGALIDDIRRTNGLSRISGMTGRYALHGLRLPTAGLTQTIPAVCGGAATDCGLYALTGQQFAVPPLDAKLAFSFSLTAPNDLSWVKFGGPKLTMTLQPPPANDTNWAKVAALQSFLAGSNYVVSPPGTSVGPQQIYRDQPTTWPTTSLTGWQNAGSVTLPYGTAPAGVQALRLWGLPDTLLNLDDANRSAPPRVQAMRGEYDEGTGQTVETELKYHGWATRVGLTIKKIPADAGSPTGAFTYQLIGSGEADIVLLERLLTELSGDSTPINSLVLLYPPDASTSPPAGLQSDNGATVTLGILQANLSTVTNPPTRAFALRAQQSTFAGCLNGPYDFVKLLWECSITRSGGYYLYYFESASGTGFPGTIFNDKGEASLTLLVVQTKPSDATKQDLVGGYINCLITGDAFDAKSTVYAKSAPLSNNYQPLATDSLASFAYRYYMDPVALAEANPAATLAAKPLTLARGVYEVGSTAPGGDPGKIAEYFKAKLTDLKAANPQITDWNQTLPADTVLRLPTLNLTVGTSPGGTTLSSIAAYYGSNVSEIAADNPDTIGLLAIQDLTVPGGPMSRSSTVPAGCISIAASRAVPTAVPAPSDPNFGRLYIENQIVLLGYRMYGNAWFKVTNPGLPISHSDDPPSDLATDRTRTPMRATLDDPPPWKFQRAIPAARNAVITQQKTANLPDPIDSPYAGVGGLAQLDLGWVDAFGNTVKSDIGSNPDGTPTRNRPPLPVNYVDALIGFGQWPGISADYSVLTPNGGSPTVTLGASFDPSGYSPDPNSKVPPTDPPGWQVNAQQALLVYDRLYQQLSQMLGPVGNQVPAVTMALTSTLLPKNDLTLDTAARGNLMTWLFGQGGIYPFLTARAGGDASWPAPANYPITVIFKLGDINTEQLFELLMSFTLTRPSTLVDPAFADTAGFISSATTIKPHLVKEADGTYRLTSFANQLETCLSQAGVCAYKLASGADRNQAMQTGETKPLWLLRLGAAAGQAISFQIPDAVNPLIFAPKPLYNTLQSRPSLPYYDYVSGKGIDFTTPSGFMPVNAVDVDSWMRDYLAAIDNIFSPELLTPVALVDQLATTSHTSWQTQLRTIKESLATSLSRLVIPFFQDEAPTKDQLDAAQEAFGQQALIALSNIYAVNAVVQFGATVTAKISDPLALEPPQLYGTLLAGADSDAGASLTAAKLALSTTANGATAPLTFLVTATGKTAQGAIESVITLDLIYRGSQIEHQIGELPNIEKYKASSWLSFVVPPAPGATNWPLDAHLGPFKVPLPLRIFPTPPSMVSQEAITHKLQQPVTWQKIVAAMQWDYSFTYAESFHYPQDQTHFTTTFNIVDGRLKAMALTADPVPDLFEFITVYPQVQGDLTSMLAVITQKSGQADIENAAVALNAFVQLAQRASTSLAAFLPSPQDQLELSARAMVGSPSRGQLPYQYVVSESSVEKTNPDGKNVSALLVALGPVPPDGIAKPSINISSYDTASDPPPPDFSYGYCYTESAVSAAADYLTDVKGQAIAQRAVVLPGLNILSAQSALTSGLIERNQDLIRPRKTVDPFVYQTAPVAFPTALRPTIDIPDAIDIASFGGNTPVARTFADQLDNLFATLFAKAPAGPQTIQVATYYSISLNSALSDVGKLPIPISFLPPTAMQPKLAAELQAAALDQEVLTQEQVIAALRAGVYAWCSAFGPQAGGDLVFNLTIMTSLQGEGLPPMPLLVLEQLTLHYNDWSDHPALLASQAEAAE